MLKPMLTTTSRLITANTTFERCILVRCTPRAPRLATPVHSPGVWDPTGHGRIERDYSTPMGAHKRYAFPLG